MRLIWRRCEGWRLRSAKTSRTGARAIAHLFEQRRPKQTSRVAERMHRCLAAISASTNRRLAPRTMPNGGRLCRLAPREYSRDPLDACIHYRRPRVCDLTLDILHNCLPLPTPKRRHHIRVHVMVPNSWSTKNYISVGRSTLKCHAHT